MGAGPTPSERYPLITLHCTSLQQVLVLLSDIVRQLHRGSSANKIESESLEGCTGLGLGIGDGISRVSSVG
jgi:hypothetical protein